MSSNISSKRKILLVQNSRDIFKMTHTVRTYTYVCPSCGNYGAVSKTRYFFESLDLNDSDYPKCLNCKKIICTHCTKHGICEYCYNHLSPELLKSLKTMRFNRRFIPILIGLIIFFMQFNSSPDGVIFMFGVIAAFLTFIISNIAKSIESSYRKDKIREYFKNKN